jgi:glycosyltransferase involved in cell wall biosynthesis
MPLTVKPKLLYVTRRWPGRTGGGTIMRSGMLVEALAAHYDVHLLVVNSGGPHLGRNDDCLAWCHRVEYCPVNHLQRADYRNISWIGDPAPILAAELASPLVYMENFVTPEAIALAAQPYRDVVFDAVHISRLAMSGFAEPYLSLPANLRPRLSLDLDDMESKTHRRLSALYHAAGFSERAQIHSLESAKFVRLERERLPSFDQLWVCSEIDRRESESLHGLSTFHCVPNAVRIPPHPRPAPAGGLPTLFFIGLLDYFPNEDGLVFFHREVLPLLRRRLIRPFRLVVAGAGVSESINRLGGEPEVELAGEVPDVAPYYDDADVFIAPIRAGGGTRIKILEAFSYRKPVVATSLAAEGIAVTHGRELLLADTPAASPNPAPPYSRTPSFVPNSPNAPSRSSTPTTAAEPSHRS